MTKLAESSKVRTGDSDHTTSVYMRERSEKMGEFRRGVEAAEHRHTTRLRRWRLKDEAVCKAKTPGSLKKLGGEILDLAEIYLEGPPGNEEYRPAKIEEAKRL
jgi:hypothetical protein